MQNVENAPRLFVILFRNFQAAIYDQEHYSICFCFVPFAHILQPGDVYSQK